jgi:hypothetical protein
MRSSDRYPAEGLPGDRVRRLHHGETVEKARRVIEDQHLAAEMVDHNFELGRRYYSFQMLERRLTLLMQDTLGAG